MDDQSNRKPCEAQFKLLIKGAKPGAARGEQSDQQRLRWPIKAPPAAAKRDHFLTIKQADGAATTGEFSALEATFWSPFGGG